MTYSFIKTKFVWSFSKCFYNLDVCQNCYFHILIHFWILYYHPKNEEISTTATTTTFLEFSSVVNLSRQEQKKQEVKYFVR